MMDMKMNFAACSTTRALIATLAGIGLFLVVFQLLNSFCPCSSKILPILQQSITGRIHDAAPSPGSQKVDKEADSPVPVADEFAWEQSIPSESQYSNFSEADGSDTSPPNVSNSSTEEDHEARDGRQMQPYGVAAHLFVHLGSYRGGARAFATVGLASKPLHVFGRPGFDCEWIPTGNLSNASLMAKGSRMLPDWGFGRVYTVVVVICTFDRDVGTDSEGGELVLHAYDGSDFTQAARIAALKEVPGEYNSSLFHPPYPYKYLYCGSPLYGNINPNRMREWMAYHAWLFGPSSYFVLYDAGGVDSDLMKVLNPWIELGRVKIENVREQKKYDGYYYNQFLFVNDCLHKYRFMSNWTFFFDVDEYIYISPGEAMDSVLDSYGASQLLIGQRHISEKLCLQNSDNMEGEDSRIWGFEKLVFKNVKKQRWNRKYVVNARKAFSAGVHLSKNLVGKTVRPNGNKISYYHYHDTINYPGELCREFIKVKDKTVWFEGDPYKYDGSMAGLIEDVKEFERKSLGSNTTS
ncbi:hypothetical protein O6H91_12G062600 [Diphasiastrum complanatum]|uniref:Uncharacterized protein n=1 Tax=Diphasiastrum complanatum TaxID=34168 RepID=A0ACC2C2N4_DIPCM|nr:hypothetical protein O6H91_Y175600 [Diphasiastrum complanatum]KAJ7536269.1 hypothetical protein O6H91_12G062600 [Diphasiastrum complanatum]